MCCYPQHREVEVNTDTNEDSIRVLIADDDEQILSVIGRRLVHPRQPIT